MTASPPTSSSISLLRWVWQAYFRTALIPLLVVEVALIGIYLFANQLSHDENIETVRHLADDSLRRIAQREATVIEHQLLGITHLTDLYRQQTALALSQPAPEDADAGHYVYSEDGAYYTPVDFGGSAVFYSGFVPIGAEERDKVLRSVRLDPLMKSIKDSNPLIVQIYVNTFDSLNRIYPYFDVLEQYPAKMDIPSYNFYYEADAEYNPERKVVWTDAYIDPAGAGWMASAIAPVYNGDFLEAVVGLDITVETINEQVLDLDIPWQGYGVLVGKDGTILALPPQGEVDWGLEELTRHSYAEAITQDTFKPENFNLNLNPLSAALAQQLADQDSGSSKLTLPGGSRLVSWATMAGTGWRLLILAPEERIYAPADDLSDRLSRIGHLMILGLAGFYAVFFVLLFRRARSMSRTIAEPLERIDNMAMAIAGGAYDQSRPRFPVTELQNTADGIAIMGQQLGAAAEAQQRADAKLRSYAERLQRSHSELQEFLFVASHDLQEPARKLQTFGDRLHDHCAELAPSGVRFLERMLANATRIQVLLNSLVTYASLLKADVQWETIDLDALAAQLRQSLEPRLQAVSGRLEVGPLGHIQGVPQYIRLAVEQLLDNAIKFRSEQRPLHLRLSGELVERDGQAGLVLSLEDNGVGIDPQYFTLILRPFERLEQNPRDAGTGIGLALVQKIVFIHQGTLEIQQNHPQGTVVRITLPVQHQVPTEDLL